MCKKRFGRKVIRSLVVCFALFFAGTANAMHLLITDDTGTQGEGGLQREMW